MRDKDYQSIFEKVLRDMHCLEMVRKSTDIGGLVSDVENHTLHGRRYILAFNYEFAANELEQAAKCLREKASVWKLEAKRLGGKK